MDYSRIKELDIFEITVIEGMARDADLFYKAYGYCLPAQHIIARYLFYSLFGDTGQNGILNN